MQDITKEQAIDAAAAAFSRGVTVASTELSDGEIAISVSINLAHRFPRDISAEEITRRFRQIVSG